MKNDRLEKMEREIAAVPKFGAQPHPDLTHLNAYLSIMNHPEGDLRVIHVAGTNGKGSVCAFIESILRHAGYRTALFTSPHLVRINERFRINFHPVEDEQLILAWDKVRKAIEEGEKTGLPALTWFEIIFLMGMQIFSESNVDYCIVETGLGGRLDATAVLNPLVSVITSISMDHEEILGHSIEEIAHEKAGILKKNVPAVAFDEKNGAFEVLFEESKQKNTHIDKLEYKDVTFLKKRKNKIDFSINNRYYRYGELVIKTCADYQVYNAALAVRAVEIILPKINPEAVRTGLSDMRWAGRMEEIRPDVFLDGAHNPGAIGQICGILLQEDLHQEDLHQEDLHQEELHQEDLLQEDPHQEDLHQEDLHQEDLLQEDPHQEDPEEAQTAPGKPWNLLFAVCGDKDYSEMIRQLARVPFCRIYLTRMKGSRGAGLSVIEECFRRELYDAAVHDFPEKDRVIPEIICIEDVREAFMTALHEKKENERLICIGSLYLVGEIKGFCDNV